MWREHSTLEVSNQNRGALGGGFSHHHHPPYNHGHWMHGQYGLGSSHHIEHQFPHSNPRGHSYGVHRQSGMHPLRRVGHHPGPYASNNHRNHIHERFPRGEFLRYGSSHFGNLPREFLQPREGNFGGPQGRDHFGRRPAKQVFGEYSDDEANIDDVNDSCG